MKRQVICDYCGKSAKLVTGKKIYPRSPALAKLKIWACLSCDAHVGTHKDSKDHAPLGRLANKELRAWKIKAHAVFDPWWKSGEMNRKEAYRRLKVLLGMDTQPHVGFMSLEECKRMVELVAEASKPSPAAVPL